MIHPTALVSPHASIGLGVTVGPFSIIHDNVQLGDNCVIGSHCEIGVSTPLADGRPLSIGEGANIRSHSVFYEGSDFGPRLMTGHRVTVREGTTAGKNLQIGTLCDIQGTCQIGNYVRFHSNVHIGKFSRIYDFVWIFPYVVLTNDPHPPSDIMAGVTLEEYVAVATMSVILPGVTVHSGALVGAHSSVSRDVPPDSVVAGVPARPICRTDEILRKDGSGKPAYPWRRQFHRGYPDDVVQAWVEQFASEPA
jgi:acetyltransferase-like isoleucine patch superfamily enzyme